MIKEKEKRPKRFWKERILRYPPVVFIRRNIFLFSFLFLFVLTVLFDVWNLKKYEVYDLDGKEVESEIHTQIQEYMKENVENENYFLFSPASISREIYLDIPRLKSVRIEKVVPNKLIFFVEIYKPKFASFLKSENCRILSEQGVVLDSICKEDGLQCCREYAKQEDLIFFSSPDIEISVFDDEKDRLLIAEEVQKVVKVIEAFQYDAEEITLENEILQLTSKEGVLFRFTVADDIDLQLKRLVVVVSKVKQEYMDMKFLDLRFERPVMK